MKASKGILSLSPVLVFLGVYLVSALVAKDFYRVPISAAFLIASAYAVLISKGKLQERITEFSKGAGDKNVLLMIWIFILAGAFSKTAQDIGSVEATVNFTLRFIPPKMMFAGLFLTACFISMAIGTSVGTIVALTPIASGIAAQMGASVPYMTAIIVGGAFFGDNLSFISDTTIAATQAMGCPMKDKFKANIKIVLPAVIVVFGIYLFHGWHTHYVAEAANIEWVKIIPYILVIVMALCGLNVTMILATGLVANAILGFCSGAFEWTGFLCSAGEGIAGMSELIIVTMLAGGMLALIEKGGGLDFLTNALSSKSGSKRSSELSIAALVCLANLCTANNTIAIITTGGIAKGISDRAGLSPKRVASIMDTFSCLIQGIIPYGAQLLMASSLSGVAGLEIIRYLYYPFALGIVALASILLRPRCA